MWSPSKDHKSLKKKEKLLLIWIKKKQLADDSISEAIICVKAKLLHQDLHKKTSGSNSETDVF